MESYPSQYKGRIDSAMIYTMNMPEVTIPAVGFNKMIETQRTNLSYLNGSVEEMIAADTWQFKNYDKYEAAAFDVVHKAEIRKTQFPADCEKAYEMGLRLAAVSQS